MIGGPSLPCPACGRKELGTAFISNRQILRKCRNCLHSISERLPEPRARKVIYLDQFVFSNMAKTIDPVWRADRANQSGVWSRLFDALDRALKLHLIVCPESRIHEQESIVHPQFEVLQRLYEHFAAETRFDFPVQIHGGQLRLALLARLAGESPNFSNLTRERVIRGAIAAWMERVSIRVNMGGLMNAADLRKGRDESGKAFEALFERWGREKPSFEEVYARERTGHADATLSHLRDFVALQERIATGSVEEIDELWNPRLEVGVALSLVRIAEESGMSYGEAFKFVVEFLFSEEALSAPMNEVSSVMMAGLAGRAAMGQKRPPSRGMWNDITAVSAFLPYCDAMFLDNECAQLLAEGRIEARLPAHPRVFSTRTAEDFIRYLEDLEKEAGPEWVQAVLAIYGDDWATPYRSILEQTRERRERESGGTGTDLS